ncbi:MAG: hypothetical protein ACYTFI_24905, partial [Planctomycetota bacterium]
MAEEIRIQPRARQHSVQFPFSPSARGAGAGLKALGEAIGAATDELTDYQQDKEKELRGQFAAQMAANPDKTAADVMKENPEFSWISPGLRNQLTSERNARAGANAFQAEVSIAARKDPRANDPEQVESMYAEKRNAYLEANPHIRDDRAALSAFDEEYVAFRDSRWAQAMTEREARAEQAADDGVANIIRSRAQLSMTEGDRSFEGVAIEFRNLRGEGQFSAEDIDRRERAAVGAVIESAQNMGTAGPTLIQAALEEVRDQDQRLRLTSAYNSLTSKLATASNSAFANSQNMRKANEAAAWSELDELKKDGKTLDDKKVQATIAKITEFSAAGHQPGNERKAIEWISGDARDRGPTDNKRRRAYYVEMIPIGKASMEDVRADPSLSGADVASIVSQVGPLKDIMSAPGMVASLKDIEDQF